MPISDQVMTPPDQTGVWFNNPQAYLNNISDTHLKNSNNYHYFVTGLTLHNYQHNLLIIWNNSLKYKTFPWLFYWYILSAQRQNFYYPFLFNRKLAMIYFWNGKCFPSYQNLDGKPWILRKLILNHGYLLQNCCWSSLVPSQFIVRYQQFGQKNWHHQLHYTILDCQNQGFRLILFIMLDYWITFHNLVPYLQLLFYFPWYLIIFSLYKITLIIS